MVLAFYLGIVCFYAVSCVVSSKYGIPVAAFFGMTDSDMSSTFPSEEDEVAKIVLQSPVSEFHANPWKSNPSSNGGIYSIHWPEIHSPPPEWIRFS